MPDERATRLPEHLDPLPNERPSSRDVGLGASLTAATGGAAALPDEPALDTDRGGTGATDAAADKTYPEARSPTTHPGGDLEAAADAITSANRTIAPDTDSPS
jgi:hypothetical protein